MLSKCVAHVCLFTRRNIKWYILGVERFLVLAHVRLSLINKVYIAYEDVTDIYMAFAKLGISVFRD